MCLQDIKLAVHAHPTLSEVVDELFKAAKVKKIQGFRFAVPLSIEIKTLSNQTLVISFQVESPASTTPQSVKATV